MIPASAVPGPVPQPLVLTQRLSGLSGQTPPFVLQLSADERTRLRGRRHSVCGQPLLLQLPRGEALQPGDLLADGEGLAWVRVEAAAEALLQITAADPLALLQAAYHLGNRHVAMEIRPGELRLAEDPVLAHLMEHRRLGVARISAPFLPEHGAYASSQGHSHGGSEPGGHGHGA
ncbi:urease accessory protein UreE [Cyanobium sp. LEGE 06143]|uniref:urease accessory protein UreE n=1 Tax=Cyanobium sp. LEGE 06143 TaxID=945727 RepID=UPI00187E7E40|nr:urease accessory protein UreE [Cyanobium sp. LEGE 06143]MBE9172038.1 urease accessory protein UreE [Cyanobium sp. LEGE 06143]